MKNRKITIITPVKNDEKNIEKTIRTNKQINILFIYNKPHQFQSLNL